MPIHRSHDSFLSWLPLQLQMRISANQKIQGTVYEQRIEAERRRAGGAYLP